jgi:hypothetical protein
MREHVTDVCPFLVPVVADRLWLYPVGVYCRRPDQRLRVPAAATLARVCTTSTHIECTGYRASRAQAERGGSVPASDEGG